jgi:hypothetical protein
MGLRPGLGRCRPVNDLLPAQVDSLNLDNYITIVHAGVGQLNTQLAQE